MFLELSFSQFTVMVGSVLHYYSIAPSIAYIFIGLIFGISILQLISYKITMNIEIQREKGPYLSALPRYFK